jgi:peptidoglycan/LPS O-acetylase OafA/YrhL
MGRGVGGGAKACGTGDVMAEQTYLAAAGPATAAPRVPRLYFPYIDMARAAAVTLVLVYHLIVKLDWKSFPSTWGFNIFRIGWMGVDLFFVISGFVISLSLIRTAENFGIDNYKRPYFRNRLARIVPLYFLTSWCYLVLVVPQWFRNPPHQLWTNILSHIFFIHNLSTVYAGALNGPTWTIAIEMQFYIFMAIVFKWLPRHRPILVCLVFIMIALAWRAGAWYTFDPSLDVIHRMTRVEQLPGRLDAFGLGCAIALIVWNRQHPFHRYLQPHWINSIAWFCIAIFLSLISWKILWSGVDYWKSQSMVIFFRLLLVGAFTAWVGFLVSLRNNPFLIKIFCPISYVGKISYGIYLWHMLVIESIMKIGITHPKWASGLIVVLVLAISSFTWHFFEQLLIRKYHDKPPQSPIRSATPSVQIQ